MIEATSSSDLTLAVIGDSGTHCNDDSAGSLDPIVAEWFGPGLVRIYVGSHNPRVSAVYELTVPTDAGTATHEIEFGPATAAARAVPRRSYRPRGSC